MAARPRSVPTDKVSRFRSPDISMKRSTFLGLAGAVLAARRVIAQPGSRMHQRKIPSSGEMLSIIGCGTRRTFDFCAKPGELLSIIGCGPWRTFDGGAKPEERAALAEVLRLLFDAGGSVIDSSPMYG